MRKIEISPKTIIFTTLFILGLYFLWMLKDLIFSLFIAFILMSALKPMVNWFQIHRVPRPLAAVLVYVTFLGVFSYLISLIIPPIVIETTSLIKNLPFILERLTPMYGTWINFQSLGTYVPSVTTQAFQIVSSFFSNAIFIISTLFFGFYLLLEENIVRRALTTFLDDEQADKVNQIFTLAEKRMTAWFWGEITLMLVVGFFTFLGLNLIGIKYALALAVIAGLLEAVPNIGPVISAIPAVIIAASVSPFMASATLALYFIIQQLENQLIVPIIMKRAVGLDPIVTLIALVIGGKIGNVIGVLLAIPAVLFLQTAWKEIRHHRDTAAENAR